MISDILQEEPGPIKDNLEEVLDKMFKYDMTFSTRTEYRQTGNSNTI